MREITVSKPQSGFYETILGCTAIVSIGEARVRLSMIGELGPPLPHRHCSLRCAAAVSPAISGLPMVALGRLSECLIQNR
jgi:hypothetical protein